MLNMSCSYSYAAKQSINRFLFLSKYVGFEVNFKEQSSYSVDSLGTGSIMQYGTSYFSKNGQPTIVVKKHGVRQRP